MKKILHSFIVAIICNSLIFLPTFNAIAADNLALPSGDVIAPQIKHTPVSTNIKPTELARVRATVTDNVGVKSVTIFYRDIIGGSDFKRKEMSRDLATDDYVVTLPASNVPGVEYFIQATDQAGNTVLHGHIFSPLKLAVSPGAAQQKDSGEEVVAQQEDDEQLAPTKGINKWVWIGLGVLAVGALASGGGGGGGDNTATLNINAAEPVTP